VVVKGRVEIRPMMPLTATIDHRYADRWHISQMIRPFSAYLKDPAAFEPSLASGGDARAPAQVDEVVLPDPQPGPVTGWGRP
jgi:hypothetical protein